jgi:hypothetical protein
MTLDIATVRLTRQKMNTGIWACAGITMSASAISGVTSFYTLQNDGWGIASGAMTALAVDVALWVVLTGDHLLERIGLTSGPWGRALRWGTAAMSVVLNCLAAIVLPIQVVLKIPLILVHAFVPLIMVGLAEYRGECARVITPVEVAALAEEEARTLAKNTPIVAPSERISATSSPLETATSALPAAAPALERSSQLQRSLGASLSPTTVTPFAYKAEHVDNHPARPRSDQRKLSFPNRGQRSDQPVPTPTTSASARRSDVRDTAFAWLDRHHNSQTTAAKLAEGINGSPHTCKKLLGEWRKNRQEVAS